MREAITSRLKAIKPPKIQLPNQNNQGVILSTRLLRAFMLCLDCSSGPACGILCWGPAGVESFCDISQLLFVISFVILSESEGSLPTVTDPSLSLRMTEERRMTAFFSRNVTLRQKIGAV